jgi:hypothetical protein
MGHLVHLVEAFLPGLHLVIPAIVARQFQRLDYLHQQSFGAFL